MKPNHSLYRPLAALGCAALLTAALAGCSQESVLENTLSDNVACGGSSAPLWPQVPQAIATSRITLASSRDSSWLSFLEGAITPPPARVRATNVTLGRVRTVDYEETGTGLVFPDAPFGVTRTILVELLDDEDAPVASLTFKDFSGFRSGPRLSNLGRVFRVPGNPHLSLDLGTTRLLSKGIVMGHAAPGAFDTVEVWNKTRDVRAERVIPEDGNYQTPALSASTGDEMEITWSGEDGTITGTFTADFISGGGSARSLVALGFQWQ